MEHSNSVFKLFSWRKGTQPVPVNGYHTLLIMSSTSGNKVLQFSFPVFLWWFSFVVAGAILFWIATGTWNTYQNNKIVTRSDCLEKENQLARGKLEKQKQEIDYLQGQLKNIKEQAAYIQNYLGLNSEGKVKGKIGQGGGDVSDQNVSEHYSSQSMREQAFPAARGVSKPPNFSHLKIDQLDEDLEEIIGTLEKRQNELAHTPSLSPVDPQKSWVSCGYGTRNSPFTGKKQFHAGIDIAGWKGTPIIAPADGKVYFSGRWGSMGLTIKIKHDSTYITTYGHLYKAAIKKGQSVKRGEIIGYMGNSGRSTGYHLHYEVKRKGKRVNPFSFMVDWTENRPVLAAGEKGSLTHKR